MAAADTTGQRGVPQSVIVVGAGSAGSVIARRLVDAGVRVHLLEAGGDDSNPAIHDPSRMGELWHSPDDWDYFTVPQEHAAGRRLHLPRGKVLGGSHSLNAMIWVRCAPADFDHWAALGNDGWAWSDVLPVYKQIERFTGRAPLDAQAAALRGHDGPLDVTDTFELEPIQAAIIEAAVQGGLEHNPDYNGQSLDGVSQQQLTIRDGQRLNSYMAYVKPVADSELLTVSTGCHVHRLLFDAPRDGAAPRVIGVEFEQGGEVQTLLADEVVLAAGALDSPRVLLRSGIGPASELGAHGIRSVVDLPGVGKNLHDHLLAPVIFATERPIDPPRPGVSVTQSHLFWRSLPELELPDTQPIHFSVPMYQDGMTGPDSGFSLMAGIVTPKSRGSVTLSGPAPHDPLLIDLAALEDEDDVRSLVASVRQCRQIGREQALAGEWGASEVYPATEIGGADVDEEAALRDYVRAHAVTYHHQVGTCTMGVSVEAGAVVTPRLRVHGVDGLRVADASIMPRVTTGNTNAPAVLIGEQAARFILAGE
ncbi:GMC family oxidoreductase [Microterricola viridarii]|uniref:Oxidoreductase n=1 Tax=Microterricola viridarii TaxID=412690 RepID=A0A0X8E5D5_9MICO|nr:GMC family oxidoreductase N-terminal domain-containing protein [Microterricola viridarii]AMB59361.1 oxidoreductase [Microterricola viridarii]